MRFLVIFLAAFTSTYAFSDETIRFLQKRQAVPAYAAANPVGAVAGSPMGYGIGAYNPMMGYGAMPPGMGAGYGMGMPGYGGYGGYGANSAMMGGYGANSGMYGGLGGVPGYGNSFFGR